MSAPSTLYALYVAQCGDCFYCGLPTFHHGTESKSSALKRLGLSSRRSLMFREATREHLHRISDGGTSDLRNLVMACRACNEGRRDRSVLLHLAHCRSGEALDLS